MSFIQDLRRTLSTLFQVGGPTGPQIKRNGADLDVVNATDTGLVNARVADPVGLTDADTLGARQAVMTFTPTRLPVATGIHALGDSLVTQDAALGRLYVNQAGADNGSRSSVQSSALGNAIVALGTLAQFRGNQYGTTADIPGVTGFKSRGGTIGALASVLDLDVLWRATAIGVTPNLSIPLAGTISLQVPTLGSVGANGWVACEYEVALTPLAGLSRRVSFKVSSEGETQTLRGVRAGGPAVLPAVLGAGTLWSSGTGSPETVVTGSVGDLWSRTNGGAGTTLYVKESGAATTTGWMTLTNVPLYANTLFVVKGAAAGGDGSVGRPFATISAAITAVGASSGYAVFVYPGDYPETVTLPSVADFALRSVGGSSVTSITAPAGAGINTVQKILAAGEVTERMELVGFRLVNGNANVGDDACCLALDGQLSATGPAPGVAQCYRSGFYVFDCPMTKNGSAGDAVFLQVVSVYNHVPGNTLADTALNTEDIVGSVKVLNCGLLEFRGTRLGVSVATTTVLQVTYNTALVAPFGGRQGNNLVASSLVRGSTVVKGNPSFTLDPTSQILGRVTDAGLTTSVPGGHAPLISLLGGVGAALGPLANCVTLAFPAQIGPQANNTVAILENGVFFGTVILSAPVGAAGFTRTYVLAKGAKFLGAVPGGTLVAGVVAAGFIDIDVRGGSCPTVLQGSSGGGAIDVDQIAFKGQALVLFPAVAAKVFPVPLPPSSAPYYPLGAPYTVVPEVAAVSVVVVGLGTKTNTGFSVSGSVALPLGSADLIALRNTTT